MKRAGQKRRPSIQNNNKSLCHDWELVDARKGKPGTQHSSLHLFEEAAHSFKCRAPKLHYLRIPSSTRCVAPSGLWKPPVSEPSLGKWISGS